MRARFATDLIEKTGNDAGTVMKYTGNKTITAFQSTGAPPDKGRLLARQAMENVDGFLTGSDVNGVNQVEQVRPSIRPIVSKQRRVIVS